MNLEGRPILVGVDDSEASRDAAALGFRLAQAAGGPLHLVTAALDALAEVTAARLKLDPRPLEDALRSRELAAVRTKLRGTVPDEVLDRACTARIGKPERVLVDAATQLGAGAIVIGGKSRRGLSPWLRRGTAHHLLRRLDLPLLVSGPRSARIARVVVAVDLSFAAPITIAVAEEIASLLSLPLEALHVIDDGLAASRPPPTIDHDRFVDATIERLETQIWPLLAAGRERSSPIGGVAEIVTDAVRRGPAALLVLGTHGAGWVDRLLLGSTTEELLAGLPSSLLIVPCVAGETEATS